MKIMIHINSIYDLESALVNYKINKDGYYVYPDFELIYLEMGRYLLIINN